MERVRIAEVGSADFGDIDRRGLSGPLDAADLAVVHYRLAPGEGFPGGLHAHGDQEEIFVVLDGEATFETLDPERRDAREVTVAEGEAVRFAPGEYQSGRNAGDDELAALALGAPRDSEDVRVPLACPECGHDYLRPEAASGVDAAGTILSCPACEAGNVPEGCPNCGSEMQVALGDENGATVVVCSECGATAESPFWR